VWKDRDTGGEAGSDGFAVDLEFPGDRLREPFGQHDARQRLLAVDDQAELVARQPRHEGAARGCLNAVRHLDQELVAGRVAEHVVDFLELVEVDAEHGKLRRCRRRPRSSGSATAERRHDSAGPSGHRDRPWAPCGIRSAGGR
jgi:hypothetical protein